MRPKSKLISLLVPSRRPHQLSGFLDSLEAMTERPEGIEVLVKIDDDRPEAASQLEAEKARRPFSIRYLSSPRLGGQFTLWLGLEELLHRSSPDSYFVMVLTDEGRFHTRGWDRRLEKYVGIFPDHAFRLRISPHKFVTYPSYFPSIFRPECFPIYTRRWLQLTEGLGDCYGSDAQHQCIAYHLALGLGGYSDPWQRGAEFRDVQVLDIHFGGMDFGLDVSSEQQRAHQLRLCREWRRLLSWDAQQEFAYFARRIHLYIWAYRHHKGPFVIRTFTGRRVAVCDAATMQPLRTVSYGLSRWSVFVSTHKSRARLARFERRTFIRFSALYPRLLPLLRALRLAKRLARKAATWPARLLPSLRLRLLRRLRPRSAETIGYAHRRWRRLPQGLERLTNPFFLSFAALYRKTGYVIPEYRQVWLTYRRIRTYRQDLSNTAFTHSEFPANEGEATVRQPMTLPDS